MTIEISLSVFTQDQAHPLEYLKFPPTKKIKFFQLSIYNQQ